MLTIIKEMRAQFNIAGWSKVSRLTTLWRYVCASREHWTSVRDKNYYMDSKPSNLWLLTIYNLAPSYYVVFVLDFTTHEPHSSDDVSTVVDEQCEYHWSMAFVLST